MRRTYLRIYEKKLLNMPFEQIMAFLMTTEWLQLDPDVLIHALQKIQISPQVVIE